MAVWDNKLPTVPHRVPVRLLEKDFINGATARFHEKDFIKLHGATARLHEKCRIYTTDSEVMQRHWPELSLKKKRTGRLCLHYTACNFYFTFIYPGEVN